MQGVHISRDGDVDVYLDDDEEEEERKEGAGNRRVESYCTF